MKLYKDGIDVSGNDVKLTDVITMTIQLDAEYLGNSKLFMLLVFAISAVTG